MIAVSTVRPMACSVSGSHDVGDIDADSPCAKAETKISDQRHDSSSARQTKASDQHAMADCGGGAGRADALHQRALSA